MTHEENFSYDEVWLDSDTLLAVESSTYWDITELLDFRMRVSTDNNLSISGPRDL